MTERRRRGRLLSAEERALWRAVTREIAPLQSRRQERAETGDVVAEEARPPEATTAPTPAPERPPSPPQTPPPLAPLERRLRQRLGRGADSPDSRLDLHGMTQERAHRKLLAFLRTAQADGARVVLVITGKGAQSAEAHAGRGILRRAVPQWLALPEFRPLVVGYETAHIGHGGEGALYVRVRRPKGRL